MSRASTLPPIVPEVPGLVTIVPEVPDLVTIVPEVPGLVPMVPEVPGLVTMVPEVPELTPSTVAGTVEFEGRIGKTACDLCISARGTERQRIVSHDLVLAGNKLGKIG